MTIVTVIFMKMNYWDFLTFTTKSTDGFHHLKPYSRFIRCFTNHLTAVGFQKSQEDIKLAIQYTKHQYRFYFFTIYVIVIVVK